MIFVSRAPFYHPETYIQANACRTTVLRKAVFQAAKGRQSHAKRPSFRAQKTAFRKAVDYQRVTACAQNAMQRAANSTAKG